MMLVRCRVVSTLVSALAVSKTRIVTKGEIHDRQNKARNLVTTTSNLS